MYLTSDLSGGNTPPRYLHHILLIHPNGRTRKHYSFEQTSDGLVLVKYRLKNNLLWRQESKYRQTDRHLVFGDLDYRLNYQGYAVLEIDGINVQKMDPKELLLIATDILIGCITQFSITP
jgi:hypothetical protein